MFTLSVGNLQPRSICWYEDKKILLNLSLSKYPHLSHLIKASLPILIDTPLIIQYSLIETEAIPYRLNETPSMDQNAIIEQLEELIKSFGVQIRCEHIKQDEDLVKVVGGLCLLQGDRDYRVLQFHEGC